MIYIIDKSNNTFVGECETLQIAEEFVKTNKLTDYIISEDIKMTKYISRICFIDDECVYNNIEFWTNRGTDILNDFENHTIKDILNQDIDKDRYISELKTNINRIVEIDGRPGQIEYNMEVGNEFISLFREECILTEFNNRSNTSPMIIFQKLEQVIGMVQIGAFREAKQFLQYYRESLLDDFLTNERIDKYIAMLDAADSIEYATSEDEFVYHAPEETDDTTEEE